MSGAFQVSRRRFLGGSAATLGGLSTGLFGDALAAQPKAPPLARPLATLVPSGPVDTSGTVSDESPRFNVILPAEPPQPASSAMETTSATAAARWVPPAGRGAVARSGVMAPEVNGWSRRSLDTA